MRPIKFRAWDSVNKVMELNIHHLDSLNEILHKEKYNVMQFTGLHDKNGKEIYEGDILRWISSNPFSLGEIRKVQVNYIEARYWCHGSIGVYLADLLNNEYCEVIGNIYENHELIK